MTYTNHLNSIAISASLALSTFSPAAAQDASASPRHQAGQQVYMTVCFACHQPTGQGLPGLFPPLADSDWVKAKKPSRLIRMVLHGLMGPISVNGKPFSTPAPLMPPQATLTDQQIADVLSYIRTSFGNASTPVSTEEVAAIRLAEKSRSTPWTEAELLKIPVE